MYLHVRTQRVCMPNVSLNPSVYTVYSTIHYALTTLQYCCMCKPKFWLTVNGQKFMQRLFILQKGYINFIYTYIYDIIIVLNIRIYQVYTIREGKVLVYEIAKLLVIKSKLQIFFTKNCNCINCHDVVSILMQLQVVNSGIITSLFTYKRGTVQFNLMYHAASTRKEFVTGRSTGSPNFAQLQQCLIHIISSRDKNKCFRCDSSF